MELRASIRVLVICTTISISVSAQSASSEERRDSVAERRWRITLSLAIASRGPETDIENGLIAAGLNQTSPSSFWGGAAKAHPFSRAGPGAPWTISCRYAFSPPYQVGIFFGTGSNGESIGYRDPSLYLFINYSIFVLAPTAYMQLDAFRFGIGPSFFIIKTWLDDAGKEADASTATKVGVLVDAGFSLPAFSRFYFDIDLQYSFVGKNEIGPFTTVSSGSSVVFSRRGINFNHYLVAIGAGIRF
jgi:hypothetical protein